MLRSLYENRLLRASCGSGHNRGHKLARSLPVICWALQRVALLNALWMLGFRGLQGCLGAWFGVPLLRSSSSPPRIWKPGVYLRDGLAFFLPESCAWAGFWGGDAVPCHGVTSSLPRPLPLAGLCFLHPTGGRPRHRCSAKRQPAHGGSLSNPDTGTESNAVQRSIRPNTSA